MKQRIALILLLLCAPAMWGNACATTASGNWNAISWTSCGGTYPGASGPGDTAALSGGAVVHIPSGFTATPGLNGATVTQDVTLVGTGTFIIVDAGGDYKPTGTTVINKGTGIKNYGGSGHGFEFNYTGAQSTATNAILYNNSGSGAYIIESCDTSSCALSHAQGRVASTSTYSNWINAQCPTASGCTPTNGTGIIAVFCCTYLGGSALTPDINFNGNIVSGWGNSTNGAVTETTTLPTTNGQQWFNNKFINNGLLTLTNGSSGSTYFRGFGNAFNNCLNSSSFCATFSGTTAPTTGDYYWYQTTISAKNGTAITAGPSGTFSLTANGLNMGTPTQLGIIGANSQSFADNSGANSNQVHSSLIIGTTGNSPSGSVATMFPFSNFTMADNVFAVTTGDPAYAFEITGNAGHANNTYCHNVFDASFAVRPDYGDWLLTTSGSKPSVCNNFFIGFGGTIDIDFAAGANVTNNSGGWMGVLMGHSGSQASVTGLGLVSNLITTDLQLGPIVTTPSVNVGSIGMSEMSQLALQTTTPTTAVNYNAYCCQAGDTDAGSPSALASMYPSPSAGHFSYIVFPSFARLTNLSITGNGTSTGCSISGSTVTCTSPMFTGWTVSIPYGAMITNTTTLTWATITAVTSTTVATIGTGSLTSGSFFSAQTFSGPMERSQVGNGTSQGCSYTAPNVTCSSSMFDLALPFDFVNIGGGWGLINTITSSTQATLVPGIGTITSPQTFAQTFVWTQLFSNGGAGCQYGAVGCHGANDFHIASANYFDPSPRLCDWYNLQNGTTYNCNNGKNGLGLLGTTANPGYNSFPVTSVVTTGGATQDLVFGSAGVNFTTQGVGTNDVVEIWNGNTAICQALVTSRVSNTELQMSAISFTTGVAGSGSCGTVTTAMSMEVITAPYYLMNDAIKINGFDRWGSAAAAPSYIQNGGDFVNGPGGIIPYVENAFRPYNLQLKNAANPSACNPASTYNTCDIGATYVSVAGVISNNSN